MKFYDRKQECEALQQIEQRSVDHAQMTVITGRRRIGKTTLIKHAFKDSTMLYFFVARKSESLLCDELVELLAYELDEHLGKFDSMARLFEAVMRIAQRRHFTIVFDEFQNFQYVNEAIFSELQNIWDSYKDHSRINLILCGSLYSMMTKIFDDRKEPLYGRATARIRLQPFPVETLKEIMADFNPDYTPEDLLAMYMITGGVAKYVEQLIIGNAFTKTSILDYVLSYGSYFIDEGRELLSDEFGKDYGKYFSVMAAIANGITGRGQIKTYTGIEVGGYLDKLETIYDLLYRYRPFMAPEGSRNVRYGLKDNFLTFWFRFIYKYRSAVEIGNLDYVRQKVRGDYDVFSGMILERYFREQFRQTGLYNIVTNYWKKDGADEIDLIAVNEADHQLVIGEIKRNPRKISIDVLKQKASKIVAKRHGWTIDYKALSLADML